MGKQVFRTSQDTLLCLFKEEITLDRVTAIIEELAQPPQSTTITDVKSAATPNTLINAIRLLNCSVNDTSLTRLLGMQQINKIEINGTPLTKEIGVAICMQALQRTSNLEIRYKLESNADHALTDTFVFYNWIMNWRKLWWLDGTEMPSDAMQLSQSYHQLVATSSLLQMRFFLFIQRNGLTSSVMLTLPEWTEWCKDIKAHLSELKQFRNSVNSVKYYREFHALLTNLQAEMQLFSPQFPSDGSEDAMYYYFMLLDSYRNIRFLIAESNYHQSKHGALEYARNSFRGLMILMAANKPYRLIPAINWLYLSSVLLLYRHFNVMHNQTQNKHEEFSTLTEIMEVEILEYVAQKNSLGTSPPFLAFDINNGLLRYFSELDLRVQKTPTSNAATIAKKTLILLLQLINRDPNNCGSKLAFVLLLTFHIRIRFQSDIPQLVEYVDDINSLILEDIKKIGLNEKSLTPSILRSCRNDQLWLLEQYFNQILLDTKGLQIPILRKLDPADFPLTRLYLSGDYHAKHPLAYVLLKWEQKIGTPLFQPDTNNRLLDRIVGFQEKRILIEKVLHYFLKDLEEAPDYFKQLQSIVSLRQQHSFPAMIFDSYSSICGIRKNTIESHLRIFFEIAASSSVFFKTEEAEKIRLPKPKRMSNYTAHELEYALQFLEKMIRLFSLLNKEENEIHLIKDMTLIEAKALQEKSNNLIRICKSKQAELINLIHEHKMLCEKAQQFTWETNIQTFEPKIRKVRYLKQTPHIEKPARTHTTNKKEDAPSSDELVEVCQVPTYISVYPRLKLVYSYLENANYIAAINECQTQIETLNPMGSEMTEDPSHFPQLAYLYYGLADSLKMQPSLEVDTRLVYGYLLQGYQYAKRVVDFAIECDEQLMQILQFLIQEVESHSYFQSQPLAQTNEAEADAESTSASSSASSNEYHCQLTPPIKELQKILFQYFQCESFYFYGSFVSISLLQIIHPNKLMLRYSDVDIVIFCADLNKAFEFMKKHFPTFMRSKVRPGLYRGSFQKVAFDIQILSEQSHDPVSFAKTLGIGARSGMANYLGKFLDLTEQVITDILGKTARFLPKTVLTTNPLAVLNHLRTQAQFEFGSNDVDDKRIHAERSVLLTLPSWLLRDYFARHFLQGFAQNALSLWFKYKIFDLLFPSVATVQSEYFKPLCQKFDVDFQRYQTDEIHPMLSLLAKFLQVVVLSKLPTVATLRTIIAIYTDDKNCPLLQNLPLVALENVGSLIYYGIHQSGFFSKSNVLSAENNVCVETHLLNNANH